MLVLKQVLPEKPAQQVRIFRFHVYLAVALGCIKLVVRGYVLARDERFRCGASLHGVAFFAEVQCRLRNSRQNSGQRRDFRVPNHYVCFRGGSGEGAMVTVGWSLVDPNCPRHLIHTCPQKSRTHSDVATRPVFPPGSPSRPLQAVRSGRKTTTNTPNIITDRCLGTEKGHRKRETLSCGFMPAAGRK
jgi:hypothetical protein